MILQKKKIEVELAKVMAIRMEMELKVFELNEAIDRISKDIDIQKKKEGELSSKLAELKET